MTRVKNSSDFEFEGCRQGSVIYNCTILLLNDSPDRANPDLYADLVGKVCQLFEEFSL